MTPRGHHVIDVVLPAYAGMIPAPGRIENPGAGAPRVCGDDPLDVASEMEV